MRQSPELRKKLVHQPMARSFYEIVAPWIQENAAAYRLLSKLSWQEKFECLTDYAGYVVKYGTVPLQMYKKYWLSRRETGKSNILLFSRLARGAAFLGSKEDASAQVAG